MHNSAVFELSLPKTDEMIHTHFVDGHGVIRIHVGTVFNLV